MIDCTELKKQTRDYCDWETRDYDSYIRELLPVEFDDAQAVLADDELPRLQALDKCVNTLAFTVGDSLEPLLQSICVLQPCRVALILNRKYSGQSGKARGKQLKRLIASLSKVDDLPASYRPNISKEDVVPYEIDADTPTQVFRALQRAFSDENALVSDEMINAVDITGAKKSMVVGAFLFAAHSGLPITYVDFDEDAYVPKWRRPYGFLCKIRPITNPYEAFGLRDWQRIRQLYERYDFRGARELLGKMPTQDSSGTGILGIMSGHLEGDSSGPSLYDASDIDKVDSLAAIFEMYEAWDSGDFVEAYSKPTIVPKHEPPSAITILGSNWFQLTANGVVGGPDDFYANRELLKIYALDELHRIKRLINYSQDYRSAFLRAGGLNEVVMVSRFAQLLDGQDREKILEVLRIGRTPTISALFDFLVKTDAEKTKKYLSFKPLNEAERADLVDWVKTTNIIPKEMSRWWKTSSYSQEGQVFKTECGWKQFTDLRNNLAHRYVSVSEALACDAYRFVQANIEDFLKESVEEMAISVEEMLWIELCDLCRLDFLPPRLREDTNRR